MDNITRKKQTQQNLDKLLAEFEQLKAEARNAQMERKAEIEENIKELETKEKDLRQKYHELENFGSTALDEIMNAIFYSSEAFSDDMKNVKGKL